MRDKCGVYSVSMSSDMLTFNIRKALSRSTLVIADVVMHPSVDVHKTGGKRGASVQNAIRCAILRPLGKVCFLLPQQTVSFLHYSYAFAFASEYAQRSLFLVPSLSEGYNFFVKERKIPINEGKGLCECGLLWSS